MLPLLLLIPALHADDWTTPHPGISLLHRTDPGPVEVRALAVDLCARGVSTRATVAGENGRTVSSFGTLVGAQAAVNGDFFSYDNYYPTGMAMGAGSHWNPDNSWEGFLALGQDHAWISPETEVWDSPAGWMSEAVGGYPVIVSGGVAGTSFSSPSHCTSLNPRTAAGLSEDRQTLYLVVVDGRSSASVGVTCPELAELMRDLGAFTAMNLDGGGSSALWVEGLGVQNDPSDGSERVVANHLAVLASGAGAPESCDFWQDEVWTDAAVLDGGSTDLDGDGTADVCARAAAGLTCHLSDGTGGWGSPWLLDALSDANGFTDPTRHGTLRFGDVTGDGRADTCARTATGVQCWPSTGDGFGAPIAGPALSDDAGWAAARYASTIRLADVTGDGRADLCARGSAGVRCWPSTGDGFGEAPDTGPFDDAGGWGEPDHYGTVRFGDITGDGRADLCARGHAGLWCYASDGSGFSTPIEAPPWSDDAGFTEVATWGTLRLVDLDGDDRADACIRGPGGLECFLSDGPAFSTTAILLPDLADANGWGDHSNASTLRFGDLDGDGDQDLCIRGDAGVWCHPYEDGAFGASLGGPALSDEAGWDDHRFYASLTLADVDGSGTADLCARGPDGVSCWPSTGRGFGDALPGPAWSDANGWSAEAYGSTLRVAGGRAASADTSDPYHRAVPEAEGCGCGAVGLGSGGAGWLAAILLARRRRSARARRP